MRQFLDEFIGAAKRNPEGVGYADFRCGATDCKLEIWVAPRTGFNFSITVKREVMEDERRRWEEELEDATVLSLSADCWIIEFTAPSNHIGEVLYEMLGQTNDCTQSAKLHVSLWWS